MQTLETILRQKIKTEIELCISCGHLYGKQPDNMTYYQWVESEVDKAIKNIADTIFDTWNGDHNV